MRRTSEEAVTTLAVRNCLPDEQVDPLEGTYMTADHFDVLVDSDCDVFKPDGSPLVKYRRRVLPDRVTEPAWRELRRIRQFPSNRATASKGRSVQPIRSDGSRSGTVRVPWHEVDQTVSSAIIGAYDRYTRFPYCRLTAFNLSKPKSWRSCLPFIAAADEVFRQLMPERYAVQKAEVAATHQEWCVPGTVFTTVTVNRNWRTLLHKDEGDLKGGFGVMAVLEAGSYDGGFLVFPKYRVAVDMRTGGVCLADVHEWHGNTELTARGAWERVSCVFYYRERMRECGTAAEELARVKSRKRGDPIHGKVQP